MKFLVDMPLSPALAVWLRDNGHDAVHAAERTLQRAADPEILTIARQEGRTIVTADLDYPRLLALAHASEPSLILFRDGNWTDSEVVSRMSDVLRILDPVEIKQSIVVIDRERIRRRRLPIDG